jgi:hypothetical protein
MNGTSATKRRWLHSKRVMMMISVATILFTAMMVTALVSLAWDLTRRLADPDAQDGLASVRAEAARIAALPRARQPFRVIDGTGQPVRTAALPTLPLAPVRCSARPALAVAA